MKIKILKREKDFIVEYEREKNIHMMRFKVLEYLANEYADKFYLYIDTNSRSKPLSLSEIKGVLDDSRVDYKYEPVDKAKRGIFSFSQFKNKRKKKEVQEHIILVSITDNSVLGSLYNNFLMNYDYAVCMNPVKSIDELILRLKNNATEILFNKKDFSNTFYDSIFIKRMRIDAPYGQFETFINEINRKQDN